MGLSGPAAAVDAWWRPKLGWLDSGAYTLAPEET